VAVTWSSRDSSKLPQVLVVANEQHGAQSVAGESSSPVAASSLLLGRHRARYQAVAVVARAAPRPDPSRCT